MGLKSLYLRFIAMSTICPASPAKVNAKLSYPLIVSAKHVRLKRNMKNHRCPATVSLPGESPEALIRKSSVQHSQGISHFRHQFPMSAPSNRYACTQLDLSVLPAISSQLNKPLLLHYLSAECSQNASRFRKLTPPLIHRQPNSIKSPILRIPPNIPNIPTINRHPIPLRPSIIQLSHPIKAMLIIVCWLHFLRFVHFEAVCGLQLLGEDFGAREADCIEGWLLDVRAVDSGLGHVGVSGIDSLGLGEGDGVVDRLLEDWLADLRGGC